MSYGVLKVYRIWNCLTLKYDSSHGGDGSHCKDMWAKLSVAKQLRTKWYNQYVRKQKYYNKLILSKDEVFQIHEFDLVFSKNLKSI